LAKEEDFHELDKEALTIADALFAAMKNHMEEVFPAIELDVRTVGPIWKAIK